MVPWHLQPKYTAHPLPAGAGEEGGEKKASKEKRQKRTRRKEHKRVFRREETSCKHTDCFVEGGCGDGGVEGDVEGGGGDVKEGGGDVKGGCGSVDGWELAGMYLSDEEGEEATATARRRSSPTTSCSGGAALEEQTETTQQPLSGHMTSATPTPAQATPTSGQATPSLEELGYQTFHRYYHVFREGELAGLLGEVEGVRVVEEFYDHENWCVLAEKVMQSL